MELLVQRNVRIAQVQECQIEGGSHRAGVAYGCQGGRRIRFCKGFVVRIAEAMKT